VRLEKISPSNWEFELITKHIQDILLVLDQDQIVRFVTPSFESILGYCSEDIIGKNAFDPVYHEDRERLMNSHRESIVLKKPKVDEYRVFHKNGDIKFLESRVMPIPNDANKLVVVSIRDITLRKSMENELEKRKNRYQQLQNHLKNYSQDLSQVTKLSELKNKLIQELVYVLPESQPSISVFNRVTETFEGDAPLELLPYLPKLIIGKHQHIHHQIHVLLGHRHDKAYLLTINESSLKESMDSIWFETFIFYTVMVFESLHVIENLSNQLEAAIQTNNRPHWILRLLFNLSEKQRVELSRDLHDNVLKDQMALYKKLNEIITEYSFDGETQTQLKAIEKGLSESIHQIQMTCNELRPPLLREIGLLKSLEDLFDCTQLSSTFKINYKMKNSEDIGLNEDETIGLYRTVQELLNNAGKHSKASNLYFHIERQEDKVILHYSDDGIGFETEKLTPTYKSIGLSGMRERIRSLEGNITFDSSPGKGLHVRLDIPINH